MDGHRRYAEDPEPRWYSGQTPYESGVPERPDGAYRLPGQRPGDTDPAASASSYHDRYAYPATDPLTSGALTSDPPTSDPLTSDPLTSGALTTGPLTSGPPTSGRTMSGGFTSARTDDPASATGAARSGLDAVRLPLGPTEYPAVRPTSSAARPTSSATPPTSSAARPTSAAALGDPAGVGGTSGAIVTPVPVWAAGSRTPAGHAHDDPTSLVPPVGGRSGDAPDGSRSTAERIGGWRSGGERVNRTRRPALAVAEAVVTALLMVPVVRLLAHVAFSGTPTAAGIVPAVLLTLGLPLTGVGLYGIAGAGRALDREAVLRPPTCYLLVGLILLLAAGLATS